MASYLFFALVALLASVNAQFSRDRAEIAEECVGKVMDIFFVLDSSTSIYVNDYRRQQQFARDVIARFDVSDRNTRVGTLTFSDDITRPVLGLNRFQNKQEIINSITERALPYRTGVTNTHIALRAIREDNDFRRDITKVVVVVTDGGSRSPGSTAREAQLLKEAGFYIFVVGIGQYLEESEWRQIASDPDDSFIFNITNFRFLDSVQYNLPIRACPLPPILDGYCNPEQAADLLFVAGSEATQDSLDVLVDFVERVNPDNQIRVSYYMDICRDSENIELGNPREYCDRFNLIGEGEDFASLINRAIEAARTNIYSTGGARRQVLVLFVDQETLNSNSFDIRNGVSSADNYGIEVVIVTLDGLVSGRNILENTVNDRLDLIEFQAGSVRAQSRPLVALIDRTCDLINYGDRRRPPIFNPV